MVLEYICSGGFFAKTLPASLANEGRRMLQALLNELKLIKQIQVLLLLDPRFNDLDLPDNCLVTWADHADFWLNLEEHLANCDAVLPIAPEQDGLLARIATRIIAQHKQLWLSHPQTIDLCTDKLQTIKLLARFGLPVIKTERYTDFTWVDIGPWVIKPIDGLGCQGSRITHHSLKETPLEADSLIVQPDIEGDAISLSCVFTAENAYLLSCNRQHVKLKQQRFELIGCTVNIEHELRHVFEKMIQTIARALPELWGYIGIDLIVSPQYGPLILEINPRLTTSFVGLNPATGIAPHLQLFNLLNGNEFDFAPKRNISVEVCL